MVAKKNLTIIFYLSFYATLNPRQINGDIMKVRKAISSILDGLEPIETMTAREAIMHLLDGSKPFEIRRGLNNLYEAGEIDYVEYRKALRLSWHGKWSLGEKI